MRFGLETFARPNIKTIPNFAIRAQKVRRNITNFVIETDAKTRADESFS